MPGFFEKTDVKIPNDTTVEVRRSFSAPRALVFRAHMEPELLRRWMSGYPGWSLPVCEMDVRAGGKYRWRWRSDEDGKEFGFHGEYKEVDAPKKVVHSEFYDPGDMGGDMGDGSVNTLRFSDDGDGRTTLTLLIQYNSKEARDAAVSTGMTDGMETSYQSLDALLASVAA
jgi:uncharacterized protein YndB with AHSA1/START domain